MIVTERGYEHVIISITTVTTLVVFWCFSYEGGIGGVWGYWQDTLIGDHKKGATPDSTMATRFCYECIRMPPKAILYRLFFREFERGVEGHGHDLGRTH